MRNLKKLIYTISIIIIAGLVTPLYPCTTGGAGSPSCSTTVTESYWGIVFSETTHSVSCGDGYYACCDHTGAECLENGTAEPERVRVLK